MKISNCAVALIFSFILGLGAHSAASPALAQTQILDDLFAELLVADDADWEDVEKQIWSEWSKSGSKAMDLLLQRGRAEMEKCNIPDAINHYSALIDHAPEFAEGWNARATAWFVADRYGLSMSDIRQTLILEPRHFGAMAGLGMILERIDKPEAALKIYLEAEKVHPNRPDVKVAIKRLSAKIDGVTL